MADQLKCPTVIETTVKKLDSYYYITLFNKLLLSDLSCGFLQLVVLVEQRGDGEAAVRGGVSGYTKQTHHQHHHICTHTDRS